MATTHPPAAQSSTSPNGSSTAKPPSSHTTKSLHNGENPASNVTKTSAPNASTTQKGPAAAAVQQAGQQQPTQQSPTLGGDSNANFKFDFYGSTPSMSNLSFGSFPSLPSLASMPPGSMPVEVGSNGVLPPPADNGRLVAAPATSNGGRPVVPQQPSQQQAPQMQQAPPRGGAPAQQSRGSGGAQGSRPSGGSQNLTPLQPHPSAPAAGQQPPQQPQAMPPQPAPSSPGSSSTAVVPASPGQSDRRVINPVTVPNGQNFVDITEYLNMPQSEAAKKLSIPPSTLSKRWKEAVRNRKWPWRVVCKLDKEIMTLLHNVPQGAPIPEEIEGRLGYLMRKRQEELKPVVIRL